MCYTELVPDNILHMTITVADDPEQNETYWDHASIVSERLLIVADVIADPEFVKIDYTVGHVNVKVEWVADFSSEGKDACYPAALCEKCGNAFTPCEGDLQSANEPTTAFWGRDFTPIKIRGCPHCGQRRLMYDAEALTWTEMPQAWLDEQEAVEKFLADFE